MKKTAIVLVVLLATSICYAKEKKRCLADHPLTDAMIYGAITFGAGMKGTVTGLSLTDKAQGFFAAMDAMDGRVTTTTGFSAVVYSPYSWIAQQASWEAKKYKEFTAYDVTEDMTEGVVRVFANPDVARSISSQGMVGTSGVEHVIIRSTKKKEFEVLQPLDIQEDVQFSQNAFGAEVGFSSAAAVFDIEGVKHISSLDKKGEFFVVVIGLTGEEKKFKVKSKHFKNLP